MRRCTLTFGLTLALLTGAAFSGQRSPAEILSFKRENPCPSTGLRRGACPGYHIDHADPLCAGGVDRRENMQWLTIEEHRWKTRSDVRMCKLSRRTP